VDIDNTICETDGMSYKNSKPIKENIEKINKLFDAGHKIIYWTSRAKGFRNYGYIVPLTIRQLNSWGCKRTSLKFGKPIFDVFIDDKALNSEDFFADTKIKSKGFYTEK